MVKPDVSDYTEAVGVLIVYHVEKTGVFVNDNNMDKSGLYYYYHDLVNYLDNRYMGKSCVWVV